MLNQQRSRPSSAIERSPKPRATCLRATPPTCFSRASGSAMGSLTSTWSRIRSPVPVRGSTGAEQFVVTSAHVGCVRVCVVTLFGRPLSHMFVCACGGGGCLGSALLTPWQTDTASPDQHLRRYLTVAVKKDASFYGLQLQLISNPAIVRFLLVCLRPHCGAVICVGILGRFSDTRRAEYIYHPPLFPCFRGRASLIAATTGVATSLPTHPRLQFRLVACSIVSLRAACCLVLA